MRYAIDNLRARTGASWGTNGKRLIPLFLFAAALILRMVQASGVPVVGDQLSSIDEAQHLGTNIHGMPYFIFLRIWMELGDPHSVLWVRIPSVLMGSLSIPIIWCWLHAARGFFVATVTSILVLVSPLAVEYAQEIRYYALYLLSASLFFWFYWQVTAAQKRGYAIRVGFILSACLLATSHLLGVIVVCLVVSHWLFARRHFLLKWQRILIGLILTSAGIGYTAIFLWPSIAEPVYAFFSRLIASSARTYEGPRGWGITTFAKLALLFHFFALGQSQYPLTMTISLPGLLLVTLFCLLGILTLLKTKQSFIISFIVIVGSGQILLVYLILDPLLPPSFADSATPKFVLPALPLLLWLCVEGVHALPHRVTRTVAVTALVLVQGIGLYSLYDAGWSYSGKERCCWQDAKAAISAAAAQGSLVVLADGRSFGSAQYYFGQFAPVLDASLSASTSKSLATRDYAIFVSSDYRRGNRCDLRSVLAELAIYRELFAFVNYPTFIYGYNLSLPFSEVGGDERIAAVPFPHSLYGIEFQDLKLPQSVRWQDESIAVTGMFFLPTCTGDRSIRVDDLMLAWPEKVSAILLLSNLTNANDIPNGAQVGEISVTVHGGSDVNFGLYKGFQTQAWDQVCLQGCWSALTWDKKVAFVGHSDEYYPDAYRDFDAHIWAVEFAFPVPSAIESIEIRLADTSATLNIWGLYSRSVQ